MFEKADEYCRLAKSDYEDYGNGDEAALDRAQENAVLAVVEARKAQGVQEEYDTADALLITSEHQAEDLLIKINRALVTRNLEKYDDPDDETAERVANEVESKLDKLIRPYNSRPSDTAAETEPREGSFGPLPDEDGEWDDDEANALISEISRMMEVDTDEYDEDDTSYLQDMEVENQPGVLDSPDLPGGDTGEIPIVTDMNQAEHFEASGDYAKALEYYKKAAESSSGEACWCISKLYSSKKGFGFQPAEQLKWAEKAASLGHPKAIADLPIIQKAAKLMGQLGEISKKETKKEKKAKEVLVAWRAASEYVEKNDHKSAVPYFIQISKTAYEAQYRAYAEAQLARLYFLGGGGVLCDDEKAKHWATKARDSATQAGDNEIVRAAESILEEIKR